MKTPVRTRLLSALLSLVMLVSLLPVSVFAAEPEAGTWTKVELADITADDTVAITMTKGDSTWVLPNNGDAKAAAKAITGTVSGNTLTTSEKDLFGWKVVKGADSFQLVSAATGKYLYSTSSNNGHPPGYRRKPRLGGGHGVRLSEERGTVPLCGRVQQPGLAQLHFCPRQYRRADPGLLEAQHRPRPGKRHRHRSDHPAERRQGGGVQPRQQEGSVLRVQRLL